MNFLRTIELGKGGNGVVVKIKLCEKITSEALSIIDTYSLEKLKDNCVFKVTAGPGGCRESKINGYSFPKNSPILTPYPVPIHTLIHEYLANKYKAMGPVIILAMEYRMMNLKEYLDQLYIGNVYVPQEKLENILCDIVSGIVLLHEKGLAHMDLSLQNVVLNVKRKKDGDWFYADAENVSIIDFGQTVPFGRKSGRLLMKHVSNITCMAPEQHVVPSFISPASQDLWSIGLIALCLYDRCIGRGVSDIVRLNIGDITQLNQSIFGIFDLVEKAQSYVHDDNLLVVTAKKCLQIGQYDRPSAQEIAMYMYSRKSCSPDTYVYSLIVNGFESIVNSGEGMKVCDFVHKFLIRKVRLCPDMKSLETLTRGKFSNTIYRLNMLCTLTPSSVMSYVFKNKEKNSLLSKSLLRARNLFNNKVSEHIKNLPFVQPFSVASALSKKQKFCPLLYTAHMEPIIVYIYSKIKNTEYHVSGMLSSDNPKYSMIGSVPVAVSLSTKDFIDADCFSTFVLDDDDLAMIVGGDKKNIIKNMFEYLSSTQNPRKRIFQDFQAKRKPPVSCKYLATRNLGINSQSSVGGQKVTGYMSLFQDEYFSLNQKCAELCLYEIKYEEFYSPDDCISNILCSVEIDQDLLIEAFGRCILVKLNDQPELTPEHIFNQEWIKHDMNTHCNDIFYEENFKECVLTFIHECELTRSMSSALLGFMHGLKNEEIRSNIYMYVEKRNIEGIGTGDIIVNPNSKFALRNIINAAGLSELWSCEPDKITGHSVSVLGFRSNHNFTFDRTISLFYKSNEYHICDVKSSFPLPKFIIDITVHHSKGIVQGVLDSISDIYCRDLIDYMKEDLNIVSTENLYL